MPSLYGPRGSFPTRQAADAFARHVTRELTAGGLPHWLEILPEPPARFTAFVHRFSCPGGTECHCASE